MLHIVSVSARAAINMPAKRTGFHELRKEIEADQEDGFCLSVDSRMGGSLSPVRKDHLQRKSGSGRCSPRNEFMIQTQIHSNIYSIKFGRGILAEIQSLH